MEPENAGEDVLLHWLLRAYAGTREIHDVTPRHQQTDFFATRLLVAVNENVQAPRLLKREEPPHHLWIVPPELWEQARAGQAALPDGFERMPTRSVRRTPQPEDTTTVQHLTLKNFRCFEQASVSFNAGMNVLIGQNGAGKTTVLDALAMGLAGMVRPLHASVGDAFSGSWLPPRDVRVARIDKGGTTTFEPQYPARIDVDMRVFGERLQSGPHSIRSESGAVFTGRGRAIPFFEQTDVVRWAVQDGFDVTLPLIAYYRTGRMWRGGQERTSARDDLSRFAGYEGCLEPSTHLSDMQAWFRRMELLALQDGHTPPVLEASKRAIMACLDGFDLVRYDARLDDLAARSATTGLLLGFEQLSDGQRNMLGMVADMAYRAATLNPHLGRDAALQTPGVVLIDELDLHLHPAWQRRVVNDLRRAFPRVQFIATTHSPQVIGEVKREEVLLIGPEGVTQPSVAWGADSNWILDHVMTGATSEAALARALKRDAEDALAEGDLLAAGHKLQELRSLLDGETGELARLESSLHTLEALARDTGPEEAIHEND